MVAFTATLTPQNLLCRHPGNIDQERRELEAIARARQRWADKAGPIESWEQRQERLDAAACPATMAAFDALLAAPPKRFEVSRKRERTASSERASACQNQIARTRTETTGQGWETQVVMLDCERRACPACGPIWAHTWARNCHANFADAVVVGKLEIDAAAWPTINKTINLAGGTYVRIPTAPGLWLIITDTDLAGAERVPSSEAIRDAEAALDDVSRHARIDRRKVTASKTFVKPAQVRSAGSDPTVIYGQLTRFDSDRPYETLAKAAEAAGVTLTSVIADQDDDPTRSQHWRLRGAPLAMQVALAKLGHRTDAELLADRADRKAAQELDDLIRRDRRRRPDYRSAVAA